MHYNYIQTTLRRAIQTATELRNDSDFSLTSMLELRRQVGGSPKATKFVAFIDESTWQTISNDPKYSEYLALRQRAAEIEIGYVADLLSFAVVVDRTLAGSDVPRLKNTLIMTALHDDGTVHSAVKISTETSDNG